MTSFVLCLCCSALIAFAAGEQGLFSTITLICCRAFANMFLTHHSNILHKSLLFYQCVFSVITSFVEIFISVGEC